MHAAPCGLLTTNRRFELPFASKCTRHAGIPSRSERGRGIKYLACPSDLNPPNRWEKWVWCQFGLFVGLELREATCSLFTRFTGTSSGGCSTIPSFCFVFRHVGGRHAVVSCSWVCWAVQTFTGVGQASAMPFIEKTYLCLVSSNCGLLGKQAGWNNVMQLSPSHRTGQFHP